MVMVSTRGRYALRIMIDLSENGGNGYTAMKTIAQRQEISLKYLEKILPLLVKANMVEGVSGKGGGYKLTQKPEEYRVGDILRVTEGDLAPVACLECNAEECQRKDTCRTLPMWIELDRRINDYLDSVTLKDLINE